MYVQKYTQEENIYRENEEARAVTVPENYGGSTFTSAEAPESEAFAAPPKEEKEECAKERSERPPPADIPRPHGKWGELLPLLLSLLLSENQEWEDIATLLLFLVLF